MDEIVEIALSEIKFNEGLYPREAVDNKHVESIVEAIRAGHELPPIVVDSNSGVIVDGEHRRQAHVILGRKTIKGRYRAYASHYDLMTDAIKYNSAHGKPLTEFDKVKCLRLREAFKMEEGELLSLLKITRSYAESLRMERTNGRPGAGIGKPRKTKPGGGGRKSAASIPDAKPRPTNIKCPSCAGGVSKAGLEYKCTACGFALSSWNGGDRGRCFLFVIKPEKISRELMLQVMDLMRGISKGGD